MVLDPPLAQGGTPLALPIKFPVGGMHRRTYLVQRQCWVKIGVTRDLATRLAALREPRQRIVIPFGMDVSEPLIVLAVIPRNVERFLHQRYAHLCDAGEWFVPDHGMRADIEALAYGAAA